MSVKERLVNNFMFGVGYSDADGVLVNASMNFKNFLGTGKEVALNARQQQGKPAHQSQLHQPVLHRGWHKSKYQSLFNTYRCRRRQYSSYTSNTDGIGLGYGIPISEDRSLSLGIAYERIELQA